MQKNCIIFSGIFPLPKPSPKSQIAVYVTVKLKEILRILGGKKKTYEMIVDRMTVQLFWLSASENHEASSVATL